MRWFLLHSVTSNSLLVAGLFPFFSFLRSWLQHYLLPGFLFSLPCHPVNWILQVFFPLKLDHKNNWRPHFSVFLFFFFFLELFITLHLGFWVRWNYSEILDPGYQLCQFAYIIPVKGMQRIDSMGEFIRILLESDRVSLVSHDNTTIMLYGETSSPWIASWWYPPQTSLLMFWITSGGGQNWKFMILIYLFDATNCCLHTQRCMLFDVQLIVIQLHQVTYQPNPKFQGVWRVLVSNVVTSCP